MLGSSGMAKLSKMISYQTPSYFIINIDTVLTKNKIQSDLVLFM